MKTLAIAFLFTALSAIAQPPPAGEGQCNDCRNNCGEFQGGCESCHIQQGPCYLAFPTNVCDDCNHVSVHLRKPAAQITPDFVDTVRSAIFGSLSPIKPARPVTITAREHDALMRRALLIGLAKPKCSPQFKPDTIPSIRTYLGKAIVITARR